MSDLVSNTSISTDIETDDNQVEKSPTGHSRSHTVSDIDADFLNSIQQKRKCYRKKRSKKQHHRPTMTSVQIETKATLSPTTTA